MAEATDDLATIRERAAAHQRDLEFAVVYLTPKDLAARWRRSQSSIRDIPRADLPYMTYGGPKHVRRRYHPDDVARYEATFRGGDAAHAA